jgi:type III restriction enzyme
MARIGQVERELSYTGSKNLPAKAERITDLTQLHERHRFLIFNKKFQEGWDDPQAYVAYFDGETKNDQRIKQIIGRIIRQPGQRAFKGLPDLNTAFIFVSSPDTPFAGIVKDIRKFLVDEYGADQDGEPNVHVHSRAERPVPVPLRASAPECRLPVLALEARNLDLAFAAITLAGKMIFPQEARELPGLVRKHRFDLTDTEEKITEQTVALGQHIRSLNRDHFLDSVRSLSRRAFDRLPPDKVVGPMFEQDSAALSDAQRAVRKLATEYVVAFESAIGYTQAQDQNYWTPRPLEPTQPATLPFNRSLHPHYPDNQAFLNGDEKPMCQALDDVGEGWWMRNPQSAGSGGYGIPMPRKVNGSETFYPDFLWWIDGTCYAIETTALNLLLGKLQGKLLNIVQPKIALVIRGKVAADFLKREEDAGWTLILAGPGIPQRTFFNDLGPLLAAMRRA